MDPEKGHLSLIMATPGHGKSTLLKDELPKVIEARTPADAGYWPWYDEPFVPVYIFDPKREIAAICEACPTARVMEFTNAGAAASAAMKDKIPGGIVIIEELMTVRQRHYEDLTDLAALRRFSTGGEGLLVVATTQRPKIMPVAYRAIADSWITGQITEPPDLDALRQVAGMEYTKSLPSLDVGEWEILEK